MRRRLYRCYFAKGGYTPLLTRREAKRLRRQMKKINDVGYRIVDIECVK